MAAKASMIAVSKHLALTVARDGVTVNSVAPGSVLFPGGGWERWMKNNSEETVRDFIRFNLPMGKFGWPGPIGATVAFLASQQADLITGVCVNVDGGQSHNLF
jgi:3-oxoacyl-[acyl-carrier protein] reductase